MSSSIADEPMDEARRARSEEATHPQLDPRFKFKHQKKLKRRSKRKHEYHSRMKESTSPTNTSSTFYSYTMQDGRAIPTDSSPNEPHDPKESSSNQLDPDITFRESLFEAMADDEGAEYWEGVYGQPIHTYPRTKKEPTGELREMDDDEYAAYVRTKMYEKTHQHLMEEKARREEARRARSDERRRQAEYMRKTTDDAYRFQSEIEASLRRGEERKTKRMWSDKWAAYLLKWDTLNSNTSRSVAIASIPWPVESGLRKDVDMKKVKRFFLHAPTGGDPSQADLSKILKLERVRWHPDKIQQKLGGQGLDSEIIQAVTAVFQIIDRIWSEIRDGK